MRMFLTGDDFTRNNLESRRNIVPAKLEGVFTWKNCFAFVAIPVKRIPGSRFPGTRKKNVPAKNILYIWTERDKFERYTCMARSRLTSCPAFQIRDFTIYDVNLNGDVLQNQRIVSYKTKRMNNFKSRLINQQRPRSVNNINVDIFTCLGPQASSIKYGSQSVVAL